MSWTCPYCGNPDASPTACERCRRNPSAPRKVCGACQKLTPATEPQCCHCGKVFGNEMSWKIPVIVLMFVAAFAISIALSFAR